MQSRGCISHYTSSNLICAAQLGRPSMAGVLLRRAGAAARLCPAIARSYVGLWPSCSCHHPFQPECRSASTQTSVLAMPVHVSTGWIAASLLHLKPG